MPLPKPLRLFLVTLLTLTTLCLLTEAFCSLVLHLPYPYNWPLFNPASLFSDLLLYHPRFAFFHTPAFYAYPDIPFTYPAPVAVLYRIFYTVPDYVSFFLATTSASAAAALILFARRLRTLLPLRAVLLLLIPTVLCAYPLAFAFEQANMELVVTILTGLGIVAFLQNRGYAAATLFGLAASAKLFPIVFLGLFVARRQYRQAAAAIVVAAGSTLLSLWLTCPNLPTAWRGTAFGLDFFRIRYALDPSNAFDHSLFALVKTVALLTHHPLPTRALSIYIFLAAIAGLTLFVTHIRHLAPLPQVFALTIASILLPPVSFDYTLIHLYVPFAFLVLQTLRNPQPGLTFSFLCFAILFVPTSEIYVHTVPLGAALKCLTLLTLFTHIQHIQPGPPSRFGFID